MDRIAFANVVKVTSTVVVVSCFCFSSLKSVLLLLLPFQYISDVTVHVVVGSKQSFRICLKFVFVSQILIFSFVSFPMREKAVPVGFVWTARRRRCWPMTALLILKQYLMSLKIICLPCYFIWAAGL